MRCSPLTVLALLPLVLAACYSPTLPLPPPARDGLEVSAPDEDGWVLVEGRAGLLEPGEQAVVINLSTYFGWIVPGESDGSFAVVVRAESGDWLSVHRRAGAESSPAIEVAVP